MSPAFVHIRDSYRFLLHLLSSRHHTEHQCHRLLRRSGTETTTVCIPTSFCVCSISIRLPNMESRYSMLVGPSPLCPPRRCSPCSTGCTTSIPCLSLLAMHDASLYLIRSPRSFLSTEKRTIYLVIHPLILRPDVSSSKGRSNVVLGCGPPWATEMITLKGS